MAIQMPCARCGTLTRRKSFCPRCGAGVGVKRSAARRGYDATWQRLSRMAIALQPWCSQCGSKEDLTGDHITALANGNRRPTLDGIQVLCRSCNSRKGAR